MSRDEGRFPNAEAFVPERFLDEDGMLNNNDPTNFVFGFGRRICPGVSTSSWAPMATIDVPFLSSGRYTADASLWSAISTMLATLDFCPAKDAQGKELGFQPKWLNGIAQ